MKIIFRKIVFVIVFLVCIDAVAAYEIKIVDSFKLSQEKDFIAYATSLCVTEDELFLIPDMKLAHVKVFGNDGKLIRLIGKKGFGPEEFDRPYYSFYEEKKYGVYDLSSWRVHIYERTGKSDFKRVKTVFCTTGINDAHLKGNKLFITGTVTNNKGTDFILFYRDIELQKKNELLLPAYYQIGASSHKEFRAKRDIPETLVGGALDLFDLGGDSAYYVWEGDLSVVRVNLSTRKITRFGYKSPHYIKPFLSKEFINAQKTKHSNPRAFGAARFKMSYVHDIIACNDYVMVIYRGPLKDEIVPPFTVQFYTLDGKFINEIKLPEKWWWRRFFLNKEKNILYVAVNDKDNDEEYYIVKMKISNGK